MTDRDRLCKLLDACDDTLDVIARALLPSPRIGGLDGKARFGSDPEQSLRTVQRELSAAVLAAQDGASC